MRLKREIATATRMIESVHALHLQVMETVLPLIRSNAVMEAKESEEGEKHTDDCVTRTQRTYRKRMNAKSSDQKNVTRSRKFIPSLRRETDESKQRAGAADCRTACISRSLLAALYQATDNTKHFCSTSVFIELDKQNAGMRNERLVKFK